MTETAKIVAHSRIDNAPDIVTVECVFPRIILPELNTNFSQVPDNDSDKPPTPEPFRPVAGRDCITRDGRRVTGISNTAGGNFHGYIDEVLYWFSRDGRGFVQAFDLVGFWEDGE